MASILQRGNDALQANPNVFTYPTTSDINITTHGSDFYWAITAAMGLSTLIFFGLSFTKPRTDRTFHYITALITLVATISYFSMASNLGYAAVRVEYQRSNPVVRGTSREVFYVRYIDWVVTTPLLLLDLLMTCGMPWPYILSTVIIDEVMVITGLVGALVVSSYKWGYFVFAMFALFYVAWNIVWVGMKHSKALGAKTHMAYRVTGGWLIFLWFLYPIAWGLCEGGNVISPDSEAVFYGVLDFLAKPVFGAILLFFHRGIDSAELGIATRDYNETPRNSRTTGSYDTEKHGHHGGRSAKPSDSVASNGHNNAFNNSPNNINNGTQGTLDSSVGAQTGHNGATTAI